MDEAQIRTKQKTKNLSVIMFVIAVHSHLLQQHMSLRAKETQLQMPKQSERKRQIW